MVPPDPAHTPAAPTPEDKLARNIREVCRRVTRGRAAAENWSVRCHQILRILSIILSSLGSVGVTADKVSGNLPGETGWGFWGSIILLGFGILSQIANEFQIAQRAGDARSLAERCGLCEIQLENILIVADPRQPIVDLLLGINETFEIERYSRVLPTMSEEMEQAAERSARRLLDRHGSHWSLSVRPQRPRRQPPPDPRGTP